MNATVKKDSLPVLMLNDERWVELRDYYRFNPTKIKNVPGNKQHIILCAISQFRTGHYAEGLSLLYDNILQSGHSRKLLRQWVIPSLIVEKSSIVFWLTQRLLVSGSASPEYVAFIVSHFIRQEMFDSAVRVTEMARGTFSVNRHIYALHLRCLTLAGHGEPLPQR